MDAEAYEVCQVSIIFDAEASIIFDASRLSICFKHPFLSMRSLHAGCQMPASCGGSHAADIKLPVIEQASALRMPHAGCQSINFFLMPASTFFEPPSLAAVPTLVGNTRFDQPEADQST
ncbi:MAG: hypothetical protein WBB55_05820 [Anaerolineales bacterium]